MSVLNPQSTVPVVAKRPTEDADGNKSFTALGILDVVMALGAPARQTWHAHGERYVQDGTVFVQRGTDLKAGDEIQYRGYWYVVVGSPRGDQDHPFTGDDFGWVAYTLAGGG